MTRFTLVACLSIAAFVVPAAAQTTPSHEPTPLPYYPGPGHASARSNAISAHTAPETGAANASIALRTNSGIAVDMNQYARDTAAYRRAMRQHRRAVRAGDRANAANERAYGLAMADWRAQVAACRRGHPKACNAPTPNPANY